MKFESDYDTFFAYYRNYLENLPPLRKSPKKRKNMYMTSDAIRLKEEKICI